MAIGSVLLQPQRLARAGQIPVADALLNEDIIRLAVRLMTDGVRAGPLGEILGRSIQGTVARLVTRAGAGLETAARRFGVLFEPLVARIQAAIEHPPGEVKAVIDGLDGWLTSAVRVLENLTPEQIRQAMRTVFDILETDLGLNSAFIQDLLLAFFDDLILALGKPQPNEAPDERENRRAVAAILGRFRRYVRVKFTFPALSADAAAQVFITLRQRPDVDMALQRALCSGKAAATLLRTGSSLVDLVSYSAFPLFGEGSLGAAAAPPPTEKVSFYASKVLEHDNYRSNLGEIPVSLDTLKDGVLQASLREAFLRASIVLARGAFLYTVDRDEKWQLVDRKTYVIRKKDEESLWVYQRFELSDHEFLIPARVDKAKLQKVFRENGISLDTSKLKVESKGDDAWSIIEGDGTEDAEPVPRFTAARFKGKLTIRPNAPADVLLQLSAVLQPADSAKAPAPGLRKAFEDGGIPLSPRCSLAVREQGREWLLDDGEFKYTIKNEDGKLEVSTGGFGGWVRFLANFVLGGRLRGDTVWVNRERTQVLLGRRILYTGSDVSWHDAPIFKNGNRRYSLKNKAAEIEEWAFHSSHLRDLLDALLYVFQISEAARRGNELKYSISSNGLEIVRLVSEFLAKTTRYRSVAQLIGLGSWIGSLYDLFLWLGIRLVIKGVENFTNPNIPSPKTGGEWIDRGINAPFGVKLADPHWSALLHEIVLSLLTLVNHEEPTDAKEQRPRNYRESSGFVDLFTRGGLLVYTAAIPDSKNAVPFEDLSLTAHWFMGGSILGIVTGWVGLLVGQQAIAKVRLDIDSGNEARKVGASVAKSLAYFFPYFKLVKGKVKLA